MKKLLILTLTLIMLYTCRLQRWYELFCPDLFRD